MPEAFPEPVAVAGLVRGVGEVRGLAPPPKSPLVGHPWAPFMWGEVGWPKIPLVASFMGSCCLIEGKREARLRRPAEQLKQAVLAGFAQVEM